jgi:FkbM family methyltransferase
MQSFLSKLSNLLTICQLPNGLRLKFTEPSFGLADLEVCASLCQAGVQPRSIYDVGANVGQFALAATTVWPQTPVHSFEPVPSAFEQLQKLANKYTSIHPSRLALGKSVGTVAMNVTNHTASSSLLKLHQNHRDLYPHVAESATIQVEVSTVAEQLKRIPVIAPALLKLDVQGFESEVLKGAGDSLSRFRWILLETSTSPMYENEVLFQEICGLLSGKGFDFTYPVQIHLADSGAFGQFDALFTNKATEDREA